MLGTPRSRDIAASEETTLYPIQEKVANFINKVGRALRSLALVKVPMGWLCFNACGALDALLTSRSLLLLINTYTMSTPRYGVITSECYCIQYLNLRPSAWSEIAHSASERVESLKTECS